MVAEHFAKDGTVSNAFLQRRWRRQRGASIASREIAASVVLVSEFLEIKSCSESGLESALERDEERVRQR
jgi:hypothetical protein